jgi:hypothetical protein
MKLGEWIERQDGVWVLRIWRHDFEAAMPEQRRESAQTNPEATNIVPEIVEWLMGLERARESVAVGGSDPREVAVMMARRGVYEGIADDIKRKWGAR